MSQRPQLLVEEVSGAFDQGAQILFVPINVDERHAYLRARYCGQARAIENPVCVVLSGCVEAPDGAVDARKTPDGFPPSVEDVCDDYSGAAYGLCTAYCEAMDCDDPNVHASATGCERVATNFTKKTGDPLPCESEPVTCIDAKDDFFGKPRSERAQVFLSKILQH